MNENDDTKHGLALSEELFILIDEENGKTTIENLCVAISRANLNEIQSDAVINDMEELKTILLRLPRPYTIVQETYYIDASYRDSYYTYFSNQHFEKKKYSRRLSFFAMKLDINSFYLMEEELLSDVFIGSCVINPLRIGAIGRTLIDPHYIIDSAYFPIYARLSKFEMNIYGRKFFVKAFPYRMQDEETMRCTEVTMLNLLEYFANSYHDYRRILPSQILESEQRHSHERVLPTHGITYPILTKVLSEFGFSLLLYNLPSINKYTFSNVTQADELKRCMHYYIESGIPVALNLIGNLGPGHSVICIGHGAFSETAMKKAKENKSIPWSKRENGHPLINSADFYEDYVIVDDNQPVYQIRPFAHISIQSDMQVVNVAVPLYKRMFLDALDAAAIVRSIVNHEEFGVDAWTDHFLEKNEDVIIRLFMASSKSLKEYRTKTLQNINARKTYAIVPMPRFVWVCEFYREVDYGNGDAFGEIVIDATSTWGIGQSVCSLILMHYPHVIGIRLPNQGSPEFDEMIELDNDGLFQGYSVNLDKIKL